MSDLPEPDFKPEDVDELVRDYGVPLDPERKESLMAKLRAAELEFENSQKPATEKERDVDEKSR